MSYNYSNTDQNHIPNLNKKEDNLDFLTLNILCLFSLLLSFIFILILKKKESNYARIKRHIVMTEGISIFCFLGIVIRSEDHLICYLKHFSRNIFNLLTFNIFKTNETNQGTEEFSNLVNVLNLAMYFSMEAFSLTFSIFICLELILILRNPIAQMKSRFKPFFIFSMFLSLMTFVAICTLNFPEETKKMPFEKYFFYDVFQL